MKGVVPHIRIARPVTDLARTTAMYCEGLGLHIVSSFSDHAGFDGVMLGLEGADYHFEFTVCHQHAVMPQPTEEDLIVFYLPDAAEWEAAVTRMSAAGFERVKSFNPWWEQVGATFADGDGYRVVLQRAAWVNRPK
jgi:catechol 2,3-dioxygenase-like lactoylglutathione lyase family enzyme